MPFATSDCWPLTVTREIASFPIGNIALAEHRRLAMGDARFSVEPAAWLSADDVAAFLASGKSAMIDSEGSLLAWTGTAPGTDRPFQAKASLLIRHPWDLLRANEIYVSALAEDEIFGEVHASAVIEGRIRLGAGARILPGVFIEGNVIIGANCKVGPNCYLRGNTSLGDGCHIGQSVEIKNSLILARTSVGHLSYVGDSVLGEGVNFGAGTTTSNLRHDGKNHRSMVGGGLVDTGRRKLGAIVGDGVHTGINTSIYPGRKLWPNTTTRPAEVVQHDLLP